MPDDLPRRIVSLLPSATETLFALGAGDRVVGVSHECDFPGEARGRPALTAPRIDPTGTSAEIQAGLVALGGADHSVYSLDAGLLAELRPDLIVTQDQCEVCAVSLDTVRAAAARLAHPPEILAVNPRKLGDIVDDIARIGRAAGVAAADRLIRSMLRRFDHVAHHARHARADRPRPRTVCLEWLDPLMLAGNWVPEMIALAGGRCDLTAAGEHSTWIEWERITAFAPEAVFVVPCGFALEQTRRELPALRARPGWAELPAARDGRCRAIDGNSYFNRPGPRIADSLELLAGGLWPEAFAEFAGRPGTEAF